MTLEQLNTEYANWRATYGQGRNQQDWRFGQYIINKFMPHAVWPAAFYAETAANAYNILAMPLQYDICQQQVL